MTFLVVTGWGGVVGLDGCRHRNIHLSRHGDQECGTQNDR